jgi:DNA uptake protein ComE-like DNA-binding protein
MIEFFIVNYRDLFYCDPDAPVRTNQTPGNIIQKERIELNNMRLLECWYVPAVLLAASLIACNQQPSPQEIKQKTAEATAEAKNDVKAVGEGLREGWNNHNSLDLNTATSGQLQTLPGVSAREADRVIAGRPYDHPDDVVSRHIMSKAEFDKIADRVTARK